MGNGFLFYYPDLYQNITDEFLATENAAPPLGWLKDKGVFHDQLTLQGRACGAAFGDSFTVAEDVEAAEAWPYLLSKTLGCSVNNFSVGGYGLDQAYLRYLSVGHSDHFVLIGLNPLMLKRDGAASYTFFGGQRDHNLPQIDISKPLFARFGDSLSLTPMPAAPVTREALAAYSENDFYKPFWTPLQFPFSLSVAHAVYKRIVMPRMNGNIFSGRAYWDPVLKVSYRLLAAMDLAAEKRGARLVIVMIPRPKDAVSKHSPYESAIADIKSAAKNACFIDLHPALHVWTKRAGADMTHSARGHYNAEGNKVIAAAVAKGMSDCGITP
jgi:hypothetical protein